LISGDAIFKLSLYFFIFEMYYVQVKLESSTKLEFHENKGRVKRTKLFVMLGYGAIEYPLSTFTYVYTKVGDGSSFEDRTFVITMLAITRTLLIVIEPYMYYVFLKLLTYFFR
jgi:hypothetical protein